MSEQLILFNGTRRDEAWCAYFAGLLDGEGCITLTVNRTRIRPWVGIQMVHPSPPIEECNRRYGGSVSHSTPSHANQRPTIQWEVYGQGVIPVLTDALPHLRLKQRQAELVLDISRGVLPHGGRHTLLEIERLRRLRALREIRQLNKRGIT